MSKNRSMFKRKLLFVVTSVFIIVFAAIIMGSCGPTGIEPPKTTEISTLTELATEYYFATTGTGAVKPMPAPTVTTQDLNLALDVIADSSNVQSNLLFLIDESYSVVSEFDDNPEIPEKLHRLPWKIIEMFESIESDGLPTPNIGVHLYGVGAAEYRPTGNPEDRYEIYSTDGFLTLARLGKPSEICKQELRDVLKNDGNNISPATDKHHFLEALRSANDAFPTGKGNILIIITDGGVLQDPNRSSKYKEWWRNLLSEINTMRNGEKEIHFLWYIVGDLNFVEQEIRDLDPTPNDFNHGNFEIFTGKIEQFMGNLLTYPDLESDLPEIHGWLDSENRTGEFILPAYATAELGYYDFDPAYELEFRIDNKDKVVSTVQVSDTCTSLNDRTITVENNAIGYSFYWAKPDYPKFNNFTATIEHAVNLIPAKITVKFELANPSVVLDPEKLRCAVGLGLSSDADWDAISECGIQPVSLCQNGKQFSASWSVSPADSLGGSVPVKLNVTLPEANPQSADLLVDVYSWPQFYSHPAEPIIVDPNLPPTQTVQYTAKFLYALTDPVVVITSSLGEELASIDPPDDLTCPAETGENICDDSPESDWQCNIQNDDGLLTINISTQKFVISDCKFDIWEFSFEDSPDFYDLPALFECNIFDCK